MIIRIVPSTLACAALLLTIVSCTSVVPQTEQPTGLAAQVAGKAEEVAQEIGGTNGFGGTNMNGYYSHMAAYMGFYNDSYLADPNGQIVLQLTNGAQVPCSFHLEYLQSDVGLDPQTETVVVEPGDTVDVALPCAEIVGIGSLTDVGAVAAEFQNGISFDNRFCVPGFLNSDYACGGTFGCTLAPDTSDLDQDGDTEELIVTTTGMQAHMQQGGMGSHMMNAGNGPGGMMGGRTGNPRQ